ncbi:DUF4824 family protein [Pseudomonas sp. CrR25]|nr:DUF4824 family protein [Pseudomonas sp. CrR25]
MTSPNKRRSLWLGLGLILLSNAMALAGVYYNRSGAPLSVFELSERELQRPYGSWGLYDEESGGRSLELIWRRDAAEDGRLAWLNAEKLRAMGFHLPVSAVAEWPERLGRQRSRSVWLVLELDGPAFQRQLLAARQALAAAEERLALRPDDRELLHQREQRQKQLEQEQLYASRLFLVDAGADATALRQTYPDQRRYALLAGRLKPHYQDRDPARGFAASIAPDSRRVSVPYALREVFADWPRGGYHDDGRRVRARVAFGRRHEPWMLEASR